MIAALSQPNVKAWVQANIDKEPTQLLLAGNKLGHNFPYREAVQQIAARQKARRKLSAWYHNQSVIFPPGLSVEQASSELTANYKAQILLAHNGGTVPSLADLTGGMGIDSFYLSHVSQQSTYVEAVPALAELANHNFAALHASIRVVNSTAESYVAQVGHKPSWFYLDPARRDEQQRKLVSLHDCQPDCSKILPQLLAKAEQGILLKASPMLDIGRACAELQNKVQRVYVVAVRQEVKELLFIIQDKPCLNPVISATVLQENAEPATFSFTPEAEKAAAPAVALPQTYLYEPHSALLKAGAFKLVANIYQLAKLHPHSHLYTSNDDIDGFIGRVYKILYAGKADKKLVKELLPRGANVSVRNYPQPAEIVAKKFQVKPNNLYTIFATTFKNGRPGVVVGQLL